MRVILVTYPDSVSTVNSISNLEKVHVLHDLILEIVSCIMIINSFPGGLTDTTAKFYSLDVQHGRAL